MDLLKGIKVVDLTAAIAGTLDTMILADLGADVIKIEPPNGEHYRHAMDGAILLAMNRNKRDIALDLRTEEGQEIALKLASQADILTENFVPGTIDKLGLSYEKVSKLNPSIIYCSVSGFGQSGPYSRRPAYDPSGQAMGGIMIATGEPEGKPCRQVTSLLDMSSSLYATISILAALIDRGKTGKGRRIDITLLDASVFAMSPHLTYYSFTGKLPARWGSGAEGWVPYGAFDTKDKPIWIGASIDRFWTAFCQALNLDELLNDQRFALDKGRRKHRDELNAKVSEICQQYTSGELEAKLVEAGVPCATLATIAEVEQNPQVQLRKLIEDWDYPGKGKVKFVKTPIMIDGQFPETKMMAPQLGEHTTAILAEIGCNKEEIQTLLDKGIAVQYKPD
ncbi:MAG: CoA transferase [Dehalococcoidia bacterium]|nr:MAG: CoA transferase [Dehalococcoidia bacterium]